MMSNAFRALILAVVVLPLHAAAEEPVTHLIQSELFEVIENGAVSNKRISLDVSALKKDGVSWAECRFVVITIDSEKKRLNVDTFSASTDSQTIRDLKVEKDVLSFEMIPFALAPDRPIRIVATRKGWSYNVSAVALWPGLIEKTKSVKTEWKQVPAITLPYTTISR